MERMVVPFMKRHLWILADDLTGALDTGCCFAGAGAQTVVQVDPGKSPEDLLGASVRVICTYSRHLLPGEAHRQMEEWLERIPLQCGDIVMIKTDSAWRGNLSAVISAGSAALKQPVYMLPAYPQVGRTLRGGVIYIRDKALADSVFAKDPRSPMMISEGVDLLKMDYPMRVNLIPEGEEAPETSGEYPEVMLYDCTSEASLRRIVDGWRRKGIPQLVCGCAGLAGILAEVLTEEDRTQVPSGSDSLPGRGILVLSGRSHLTSWRPAVQEGQNGSTGRARFLCRPWKPSAGEKPTSSRQHSAMRM